MTLNGTMTELLFAMNQGSEETTVFLYTENKQPEDKTEKVIVLKKKKNFRDKLNTLLRDIKQA